HRLKRAGARMPVETALPAAAERHDVVGAHELAGDHVRNYAGPTARAPGVGGDFADEVIAGLEVELEQTACVGARGPQGRRLVDAWIVGEQPEDDRRRRIAGVGVADVVVPERLAVDAARYGDARLDVRVDALPAAGGERERERDHAVGAWTPANRDSRVGCGRERRSDSEEKRAHDFLCASSSKARASRASVSASGAG